MTETGATPVVEPEDPTGRRLPTWLLRVSILVAGVSLVAGWAGSALLPQLVDNNPRALIALNPSNPNLILVSTQITTFWFFLIGFARLVASDPFNYLIGMHFGAQAFAYVERRSRTYGPYMRQFEEYFRRFSDIIVFLAPNNLVCILAGGTGMPIARFLLANASGTLIRLILIKQFGDTFSSPIEGVVDFIGQYRLPFLAISFALVGWTIFGEFRGDNSELKTLRDLDKTTRDKTTRGETAREERGGDNDA